MFRVSSGVAPTHTLSGHTARVFNVAWSPFMPGLLASGSDDLSIHLWRIAEPKAKSEIIAPDAVLLGHTANVRALAWNFELKNILLSGSWDRSIRVWVYTRIYLSVQILRIESIFFRIL